MDPELEIHSPSRKRVVLGLAASLLLPLAFVLLATLVPPLFPSAHALTPGPPYVAIAEQVCADARAGRIPVDPWGSSFTPEARMRRAQLFARVRNDEAFTRLGEPSTGEWLAENREPGQSFGEYVRSRHNRKTATRHRLHLQPFHDLTPLQREVLNDTRAFVATFFDTETEILAARRLPPDAWSADRKQWDASLIADALHERVPGHSLGLFGLVGGDLHALGLRFVFGIGSIRERVGVHSLHRYGSDRQRLIERAFKLSGHELGHMFGMAHCVFYECLMNGVNSLEELDETPHHLCPVCHEKLHRALSFDPRERYQRLTSFYDEHAMKEAAAFMRARAAELTP